MAREVPKFTLACVRVYSALTMNHGHETEKLVITVLRRSMVIYINMRLPRNCNDVCMCMCTYFGFRSIAIDP